MFPFLSIVSPIYKGEKTLPDLISAIETSVSLLSKSYEIILIEDGSPDGSWGKMKELAALNTKIKLIKLSRNFGQHYAITAGLDFAKGEWVVVMDCDLQDRPEEIPNMLAIAEKTGAKIVLGQRIQRNDNSVKVLLSQLFYRCLSYFSGIRWDATVANFGLYHKDVVQAIASLREPIRFFPSMVKWVGFHCVRMPVKHHARNEGKSNYDFKKRLKLALDIILANSDKPLRIIIKFGFTVSFISGLIGAFYIYRHFSGSTVVLGFTSLIISIWLVGGIIFMLLGVIGLYIGKIFEAAKERPIYIIEDKLNL